MLPLISDRVRLPAFAALLSVALAAVAAAASAAPRPHVVFILADDLGWQDLRVDGSEVHDTPHLDRLAAQGRRFTQAYAPAPICSASRVAFLTGRSPARLQFEFVTKLAGTAGVGGQPLASPPYPTDLPLAEETLGQLFADAGYRTGYFGKWHVSQHHGGYLGWSKTHGPLQQGFHEGDQEFGSHPYGDPARSTAAMSPFAEGDYGADPLTEKARAFLRRGAAGNAPLFLMLSHYYVHTPVTSRARWLVDKYRARLPSDAPERRAVYAAMVETLDHLVGEVLRELDDLGLADNTLVVFTSDNGGDATYAANGPARGGKWTLYEGGLRVPFLVRWPDRVPGGTVDDRAIIGTDLFPTFAALLDRKPAAASLDGVNLLPLWTDAVDEEVVRREPLVWHFPFYHPEGDAFAAASATIGINDFTRPQTRPQSALRDGGLKLIHFYEDARDELYDLVTDPGEQYDLAALRPEVARRLRGELDAYLTRVGARLPTRR